MSASRAALGNALNGVYLHDGEQGDMVGGTVAGSGNYIATNGGNGVLIGASGSDSATVGNKVSLDIFWLRDESLEDSATLPEPGVLAAEIMDNLEATLEQFRQIADDPAVDEAGV